MWRLRHNTASALVGGGYGAALGRTFFTESQFSHEDNTSKLGFSVLNWHLARWGYDLNDGKNPTPSILDTGFRLTPRTEFLRYLAGNAHSGGKPGPGEGRGRSGIGRRLAAGCGQVGRRMIRSYIVPGSICFTTIGIAGRRMTAARQ